MFKVRVVSLDHYVSKPIDEIYPKGDQNLVKEWQEPVLRIFGATEEGLKSCVHVHGVYPYMYVPYKGGENPERDVLLLGAALDEALRASLSQKIFKFIYKVTVVSGIPLYGYHSKQRLFFKIYFYNPFHIRKASELLLSGAILGQKLQPHETHIPYTLQFMIDYNIYGMSFVTFSKVKYRRNPGNSDSLADVREEDVFSEKVKKITWCTLEVDALASDILNKVGRSAPGVNPGLQALWEDEQERRRSENRNIQITLTESQTRPDVGEFPTEVMYKARLAEKLAEVSFEESEPAVSFEEPAYSYPAEVPRMGNFLDASATEESLGRPQEKETVDVSSLIDKTILTQISGSQENEAQSESEDEREFDSVLGRNQKSEEEAELEDEEGVDLTQPLDSEEEVICSSEGVRDETGGTQREGEETFWKNMADKIFQLDGAQESSSESEGDATPASAVVPPELPGSIESPSIGWPCNIMSILSEESGCPTPSATCQTPRTFWFDHSPDWLTQNQESWIWNKSAAPFSDFLGRNQSESSISNDFLMGSKDIISGGSYGDLFASHAVEYFPSTSTDVSVCRSGPTAIPVSTALTPENEIDGSDMNSESNPRDFRSPSKEKRKFSALEPKRSINEKPQDEEKRLSEVLRSFVGKKGASEDDRNQITLKQYLKDCREIVSVDFKNLCNRDMIIIEYKSQNKRSPRNKYLIKPLDKFLESWNSAERKASDRSLGKTDSEMKGSENEKNSSGNAVDETWSDASSIRRTSNKSKIKSIEMSGGGGREVGRCYSVDENVISHGKIKMKLMKSQGKMEKDLMEGTLKRRRLDLRSVKTGKGKTQKNSGRSLGDFGKYRKWKRLAEPDTKLINEINSSFEEYFQSIVERKNFYRKSRKNVVYEEEEENERREKGETSEDEKMEEYLPAEKEELFARDVQPSRDADPIRFVTRFLSTFSQMSDVPPLSITIRLGNPRSSAPIRVDLRPSTVPSDKEATSKKTFGKRYGRKTEIENVDGPADGFSSGESSGGDPEPRSYTQKKRKRESRYKPLDVVLYDSPVKRKGVGRKRKSLAEKMEEEEQTAAEEMKSRSSSPWRDRSDICRRKPKRRPPGTGKEEKSSSGSVVKSKKKLPRAVTQAPHYADLEQTGSVPYDEMDFIGDSDDEKGSERSKLRHKSRTKAKEIAKKLPQSGSSEIDLQADAKVFAISEDKMKKHSGQEIMEMDSSQVVTDVKRHEKESPSPKNEKVDIKDLPSEEIIGFSSRPSTGERADRSGNPVGGCSPKIAGGSTSLQLLKTDDNEKGVIPLPETPSSNGTSQSLPLSAGDGFSSQTRFFRPANSDEPGSGCTTLSWVLGSKVISPLYKPLSREKLFELAQNRPTIEFEEKATLYGGPVDVRKPAEKGFWSSKMENRPPANLKLFRSSLNLLGIEERRSAASRGQKVERWSLVGCEDATITPLRKPPNRDSVVKSWFSKKQSGKKSPEKGKMKIVKPLSPGEEMDSEEEMELSVRTMCNISGEVTSCEPVQAVFPEIPEENITNEEKLGLKKGPLAKIKGIKRFSALKKSAPISQGEERSSSHSGDSDKKSFKDDNSFQIRGATVDDTFGFLQSVENLEAMKRGYGNQFVSMLVMELHVKTRNDLRPDPRHDPIRALFYAITFDSPEREREEGAIVVGDRFLNRTATSERCVHYVHSEKELFEKFLALVRGWDPDILTGYEIEMNSWGYLVQRAFVLNMNFLFLLGRVQAEDPTKKNCEIGDSGGDAEELPKSIQRMRISGRIVLDAWRVLRHEVALRSYTFENVMYHLLHERHPVLSYERLSYFWEHPSCRFRHFVVDHFGTRVLGLIKILDQLDFVNRTSELSRLFGIQFYEVLSRGSQFRVESMMLRLAKPLNYVPVSPSVAQRAAMRAPASLPLILEPESLFYTDPVIVLDFQSLYPSIIIGYNYCFSTCLGRVEKLGGRDPFEFGCTQLQVPPEELKRLEKDLTVSPAGVAFVKPNVRKGVLPTLLEKILETRLMVKKSMKEHKENRVLQKVLFSRQLGLKLIANVTYGYTAANFSGRMPCIEVGDSVVSKGRETLHRAIQLVKNNQKWGAKVVYGDTDSIFVLTPGRSREEAFRIGAEIAEAVTRDNPKPVKLKLEKVYQPCILQTKKRYLGYAFESPNQEEPAFEAKGIETVRRDGCPATGKILEKALRILFDTRDVSLVKTYTLRQFAKLYQGRVNLQDLIFAKEYRGRYGYRPNACVPALQLAKQWTQYDKRAEPRVKERVPYVIVCGPPGVPLIRLVRSPMDMISDPALRINALYYITKAIVPAMQRCFSLLGVDVSSWYAEIPKKYGKAYRSNYDEGKKRSTISQYFSVLECILCSELTCALVCKECERKSQELAVTLGEKIRLWEKCHEGLTKICQSCCGGPEQLHCVSLDCPVLYRREQARRSAEQGQSLREILSQYL